MFTCVRCEKHIDATSQDPLVAAREGSMHFDCFRASMEDKTASYEQKRAASRERRSARMREAWEKRKGGAAKLVTETTEGGE